MSALDWLILLTDLIGATDKVRVAFTLATTFVREPAHDRENVENFSKATHMM